MKTLSMAVNFDCKEVFGSEVINDSLVGFGQYVFYRAMYVQNFIFNGVEYQAVYMTGDEYYNDNINSPMNTLKLQSDSSELLVKLNEAYESDFDNEFIEELNKDLTVNFTQEEWLQMYEFFNDNKPRFDVVFDDLSDDVDDYNINEETGDAVAK